MSFASASPIVVFPVPVGPRKSHAFSKGFAANLLRISFTDSKPTKFFMERGWYFFQSGCVNAMAYDLRCIPE